jgi:hypothetical protein
MVLLRLPFVNSKSTPRKRTSASTKARFGPAHQDVSCIPVKLRKSPNTANDLRGLRIYKNFARGVYKLSSSRILAPPPPKVTAQRFGVSPPQVLETPWRQLRVTHSRLNAAMA